VVLVGSDKAVKLYRQRLCGTVTIAPNRVVDYVNSQLVSFHGWVMMLGKKHLRCKRQRFDLTFRLHMKGLSRAGLKELHQMGITDSLSSFDRRWAERLQDAGLRTR
jgi:hypothetical protein